MFVVLAKLENIEQDDELIYTTIMFPSGQSNKLYTNEKFHRSVMFIGD